ncbi:hypothetical protein [Elizabethkingia meningoseptica]|uniref:hypothetical protein n=1 Tax=Elizabethkingia meningoseptica TaxID=238 RepID=UPI00111725F6|nr:hypothetical protein [Elizabethkingia meningoseptica]MDE5528270.1 hypothetical protein [Elizabethkingia meningoseptica]
MNYNFRRALQYCFVLGGITVAMNACSSRDNDNVISGPEGTTLSVNVAGITEYAQKDLNASVSNIQSLKTNPSTTIIAKEQMVSFNGFDALVSMEKQAFQKKSEIAKNATTSVSSGFSAPMASTTGMSQGIKYRLVIYDAADVNHSAPPATNIVLTSGAAPASPIRIDADKTYNWYAFSINETGNLPDINNGIIDKAGLKNKDVLWAKGTFATQYGNNSLNITFNRNTTQVQVVVNTLGVSGMMTGAPQLELQSGTEGILKYGDLNIFDGEYSNPTSFTLTNQGGSTPSPSSAYRTTFKVHTIDNSTLIPMNNLKVKLGDFRVYRQDFNAPSNTNYPDRAFINFSSPTVALNNGTELTFGRGNLYTVNIKLIESAVNVAGVQWARSNVKGYDLNIGSGNKYFFMADPMNNLDNGYVPFYWNNLSTDICTEVFPAGTWRLPTKSEFEKLLGATATTVFSPNTLIFNGVPAALGNGFLGIQYSDTNTVINTGYPVYGQKLTLPMSGYHDAGKTSGYNITLNIPKQKIEAGYWTKDGSVFGKQYFYTSGEYTYTGSGNGPEIIWGGNVTPPSGQQFSVRCVRN